MPSHKAPRNALHVLLTAFFPSLGSRGVNTYGRRQGLVGIQLQLQSPSKCVYMHTKICSTQLPCNHPYIFLCLSGVRLRRCIGRVNADHVGTVKGLLWHFIPCRMTNCNMKVAPPPVFLLKYSMMLRHRLACRILILSLDILSAETDLWRAKIFAPFFS